MRGAMAGCPPGCSPPYHGDLCPNAPRFTIGGQHSITGERIPTPKPPYVPPHHDTAEHLAMAEAALEALDGYYGKPEPGRVSSREGAEVMALRAIAHALVALARG